MKFVVAGTGWVAGEYLKAIIENPETELHGVYSRNATFAESRIREFGNQGKVYLSYEDVVNDPDVDAIILCSTPDGRPEQVVMAAEHGKHLVIEKPLAMSRDDLAMMKEAVRKAGVTTVVGFVLRWNPLFDLARSLIQRDDLGRIFMAEVDYWHYVGPHYGQYRWSSGKALGGSSLLSAGCHAVDALRYFAGEVTEVTAYSCRAWDDSEYEFDSNLVAILKLANGGIAKVSSSVECVTPYKFNIRLLGEKGSLLNNQLYTKNLKGQTDYTTIPTVLPDSGDVTHHPFKLEIAEFVNAVKRGLTTRSDLEDAAKTMEVCFAIDESAMTGRSVKL